MHYFVNVCNQQTYVSCFGDYSKRMLTESHVLGRCGPYGGTVSDSFIWGADDGAPPDQAQRTRLLSFSGSA